MKSAVVMAAALLTAQSFAAPAAPPAKKAVAKPASPRNWLAVTGRTAEGAIVVGNPAAKVRLVEYLSLTCPHCAAMSGEMMEPLKRDYIAKGLVSIEMRHAVRDGYDFAASLLLRCEPPARYLDSIEALFATQQQWMDKGSGAAAAPDFAAKTPEQKMLIVARASGFDRFFAQRGMSPKAFATCMDDKRAQQQLTQMAGNSWERDAIPGTPLILLNGDRQENVFSWDALEPRIKAALK